MCTETGARRRISCTIFNFFLDAIYEYIILTPTNLKSKATSPDQQLSTDWLLVLLIPPYQIFLDVSVSVNSTLFNKICRLMVVSFL